MPELPVFSQEDAKAMAHIIYRCVEDVAFYRWLSRNDDEIIGVLMPRIEDLSQHYGQEYGKDERATYISMFLDGLIIRGDVPNKVAPLLQIAIRRSLGPSADYGAKQA